MKHLTSLAMGIVAAALLFSAGFTRISQAGTDTITLQLKWLHQAQFAGYYLAKDNGYYTAEHLNVNLLEGGRDVNLSERLATGQADFGVLAPEDLLIKRSQGVPLVAIAAVFRRSAVVFLARPDSGIIRPEDFIGKTIAAGGGGGIRDFQLQLTAMLKQMELDLSGIHLVDYDPAYKDFLAGSVDVTPAYITGGLIKIRAMGLEPTIIWPGDYRIRFYSDILVTTEQIINARPDLVLRFLRATLKGWTDAVGNPDEAVDHTLAYARIKDRDLQLAMLEASLPLIHTGEDGIGWMKPADWRHMHTILRDQGLISCPESDLEKAYTLTFFKSVYKELKP